MTWVSALGWVFSSQPETLMSLAVSKAGRKLHDQVRAAAWVILSHYCPHEASLPAGSMHFGSAPIYAGWWRWRWRCVPRRLNARDL
jgi:hypothetical protein